MRTLRTWREKARRRRQLYPDELPAYLLARVPCPVVFDPSLQRASETVERR